MPPKEKKKGGKQRECFMSRAIPRQCWYTMNAPTHTTHKHQRLCSHYALTHTTHTPSCYDFFALCHIILITTLRARTRAHTHTCSPAPCAVVQALAQLTAVQSTYKASCKRLGVPPNKAILEQIEDAIQVCAACSTFAVPIMHRRPMPS